ncbi:YfgM family protein [Agitococcus lubricus]|uniref:Ancillary SecYEG translocon subunit n=1 Tax=Agitococcus lubricus TaxID=1077255 RepID=A0A2T5J2S4_9GAMM|nr:tetratricopeptide repeat protein [Agitococcus lubricus]PTQ90826.1 putative negative regulator of RcsB-dependent stress response [Agitococcus lubricus]
MSTHDDEQLENLKRFWQDYGTPILVGASMALAVFVGWRYWQNDKVQTSLQASTLYESSYEAYQKLNTNPEDKAANTQLQRDAQKLSQEFGSTVYANNASLLLAKRAIENKDLKEAEKQLRNVLTQSTDDGLKSIASFRLAQVLLEKGDNKAALDVLSKETSVAFLPSREELRGDILKLNGDTAGAIKAYQAAYDALKARNEPRPILEVKMADLGLDVPELKTESLLNINP